MKLKIGVVGSTQSGKTSLSRLLTPEDIDLVDVENSSVPVLRTYHSDDKRTHLSVFDLPSKSKYLNLNAIFAKGTDVFICCIDLSKELDSREILNIKEECQRLVELSPGAQLLLVGTKSDLANDDCLQQYKKAFEPWSLLPVSTVTPSSVDYRQELLDHFVPIQRIKQVRNRFLKDSELYPLLNTLAVEIRHLPGSIQNTLAQEVEQLITQLLNPLEQDKAMHLQAFHDHCKALVPPENTTLLGLLKAIAISIVVTVVAGLIGFGVGFALGAWSGPGAFFTGLAMGTASAIAVAVAAPSLGGATMGYCMHRFLKPSPLEVCLNEVYEQAQQISRN